MAIKDLTLENLNSSNFELNDKVFLTKLALMKIIFLLTNPLTKYVFIRKL